MNEPKPPHADATDATSLTASITQALAALSERAQTAQGKTNAELQSAREALAALESAAIAQEDLIADALRELRAQEVQLAERLQARLAESAGASQKAAALEHTLEEARAETEKAQAKAVALGQQAAEAQQSADAAKKRCGELQRQVDDLEARVESAESASSERVASLEKSLEEAQTTIESLRTEIAAKEEDDVSGAEQLQTLEQQLEERTASLEEAQTTIESLRTAIAAKEEDDVAGANQLQLLEQQLEERTAALEEAQTTIESLRTEIYAKEEDDVAGAEQLQTLEQQLAERTAELEQVQSAGVDSGGAVQAELEGLRTEVKTLQLELEERRAAVAEADALRAELTESRQQISALESRLEEEMARGKESSLASQLAEALRGREEAEERLAAFQRDLESVANAEGPALDRVKSGMRVPDLSAAAEIVEDLELGIDEPGAARGVLEVPGSDRDGRKRHIGQILLDAGAITRAQLDECLDIQRSSPNSHLGEILIEQGFVSDQVVAQAIARQSGIEYVRIGSDAIDPDILGLLGRKLAALHRCIPLRADGDSLTLAMENPLDLIAIEDVERATQKTVTPVASPRGEILVAIQDYYGQD
jgi:DNA repair exonuclease SbcCD ATPase subunit